MGHEIVCDQRLQSQSDGTDAVVTTYKVKIEGTYDGKDKSGTYNAASVWKKQKGQWLAIFHTNVKQAPAGGHRFSFSGLQFLRLVASTCAPLCCVDFAGSRLILNSTMRGSRNG